MGFLQMYKDQQLDLPIYLTPELCKGKTYIVTGSSGGLGFECVKHLVRLQASRIIMAVRSTKSGETCKRMIEDELDIRGVLQVMQLDLASNDSIRAFVKQIEKDIDRVDGFIMNAGAAVGTWKVFDGAEGNQQVNLFANLLLTFLILPYMQGVARKFRTQPRIAILGTGAAFHVEKQFHDIKVDDGILKDTGNPARWESSAAELYPVSKLFLLMAVRELANYAPVSKTGVSISLTNPGLCYSSLNREAPFMMNMMIKAMRLVMGRTTEMGSRTLLYGVSVGEESHGKYLTECRIGDDAIPSWVTNEKGRSFQSQLWKELLEKMERIEPGCTKIQG